MRMVIRADVIRQPGPYILVLPAENPLGLGPLYVREPFPRKQKMGFFEAVSGNLGGSIPANQSKEGR